MPFDGSGNYTRVHDWTTDRDNGIKIQASRMDQEFDDIATSLNSVFFRTGIVPMSGDLDVGNNSVKSLASGSAAIPSIRFNSDTDTGLYRVSANQLGIATGGAQRVLIDNTGLSVVGGMALTGGIVSAGSTVWTAGNDGAGSGLDADTLDGNHGAAYAQVAGGNTFTGVQVLGGSSLFVNPAAGTASLQHNNSFGLIMSGEGTVYDILITNKLGQTVFGVGTGTRNVELGDVAYVNGGSVWHSSNDGSGSGLDADTLDGYQAADFHRKAEVLYVNGRLWGYGDASQSAYYANTAHNFYNATGATQWASITVSGLAVVGTSITVAGSGVWHAGNDGSGSGLDADTLDGQQGAYYLAASSYTAADVLAKMLTVDGAGSGLDADLLDGQSSAYYLAAASYTAADVFAKVLTLDGAGSGLDADLLDGQSGAYYTDIVSRLGYTPLNSTAYTAADVFAKVLTLDGAGSGLDADTLDGLTSRTLLGIARTTGAIGTAIVGQCKAISAGVTIPDATFSAGDAFSLYNDSAAAVTITQGAGLTQRLNGTATTGNLTLAARGFCTVWFNTASECIVSGSVS